jgi:hypothetical protein
LNAGPAEGITQIASILPLRVSLLAQALSTIIAKELKDIESLPNAPMRPAALINGSPLLLSSAATPESKSIIVASTEFVVLPMFICFCNYEGNVFEMLGRYLGQLGRVFVPTTALPDFQISRFSKA